MAILAAAVDSETIAFMADRGAQAKYVTSVSSGSLILGVAGLLKGYKATSHPPFHSGSMKTAPAAVKAAMVQMLAEFVKKSEALASPKKGYP
jgi:putative intracellular protease/amidase